jgi:GSH-dependent disulfide-bond oxidoreductase
MGDTARHRPRDRAEKDGHPMLTLYTYGTPNGRKASILLEELGLRYRVHRLDLPTDENLTDNYLAVSPVGKIPALVEELPGGTRRRLFGSGAILMFLAERTGRLIPAEAERRSECYSWLMLGISDLSPASVYEFYFAVQAPEPDPDAAALFKAELIRYFTAMDRRLSSVEYLAEEYSIADIACFPFAALAVAAMPEVVEGLVNLKRWHDLVAARPAVQRGMAVPD